MTNKIFYFTILAGMMLMSSVQAQVIPNGVVIPPVPSTVPVIPPSAYVNPSINFIRTWEPSMPTADPSVVSSTARSIAEVKQTTAFFDGLGRPMQTVTKGISPLGKDIVQPVYYDPYGREQYKYLPYVTNKDDVNTGRFKSDPFNDQQKFYQDANLNPGMKGEQVYYEKTQYEQSPLNRVLYSYSAGNSGSDYPSQNQYLLNTADDAVQIWDIVAGSDIPVSSVGHIYDAGMLRKNVMIDEAGHQGIEYVDKFDRAIMKKVQTAAMPGTGNNGWLCTYYVYDNNRNLRFVIPPKAVGLISNNWVISADIAAGLCFSYEYDDRGRCISKQLPGAAPEEMVYDVRDRLVFTRDGNLKGTNQWRVFFYDNINRETMSALYNSTSSRQDLQSGLNNTVSTVTQNIPYTFPGVADLTLISQDPGTSLYEASNSVELMPDFVSIDATDLRIDINPSVTGGTTTITATNPLPGIDPSVIIPLTYTFYDNYDYTGKLKYNTQDLSKLQADPTQFPEAIPMSPSMMINGLKTGERVWVLGTNQWLTTTTYYDDKGRTIQTVADNNMGGKDITTTLYNYNNKVLATYLRHTNPRSVTTPQPTLLTTIQYDHGLRMLSITKKLNDDDNLSRTIAAITYDEQGRMLKKRLGVIDDDTQMDVLNYEYNIRGWLRGINKDFVNNSGSTTNWFGQELSYDYGFKEGQLNGNVAGVKWKSRSDGIPRAYGYQYTPANLLMKADFSQQDNGGGDWTNNTVDYSVSNLTYDANGNILTMNQQGMNGSSRVPVDQLAYSYVHNGQDISNRLYAVTDGSKTAEMKLGDFVDGTNTTDDYNYDVNGNLSQDLNKNITQITYNYLNLPSVITLKDKGSVVYQYDADGKKLRKTVVDNTGSVPKTTTTDYADEFVYQDDVLQYISNEEGRIRPVFKTGLPVSYVYDYFEKDYLGDVRMVLTEQTDFSMYTATMEPAVAATETALFSNIDETRVDKPVGYPDDNTTDKNTAVAKLNAKDGGKKIGPSLVLRVMAGDTIQMGVHAFYKSQGPVDNTPVPVEDMVAGLIQVFGGASSATGHGGTAANNTPFNSNFYRDNYQRLKEQHKDVNLPDGPKAYLNYVLFDDQFKMVEENSGVKQVNKTADQLQTLAVDKVVMKKSGFMYVYTSNETQQDVFFDNLAVNLNSGPLLEETHYYPFGLTMAGISSNALKGTNYPVNRLKYNEKELQDNEFSDGSGLQWYDYGARMYDAQIGRWNMIDPKIEKYNTISGYQYALNNPVLFVDPDGADNIIYLKVLKGSGLSEDQIGAIIKQINANFQTLNLKTEARLFTGKDEDLNKLDPTDAVAFVGPKAEIIKAVGKLDKALAADMANSSKYGTAENVEKGANPNPPGNGMGNKVSGIATNQIASFAQMFGVNSIKAIAFLVVHAAGHNAGLDHDNVHYNIMSSGDDVQNALWLQTNEKFTKFYDFLNVNSDGGRIRDAYLKRFGSNKPNAKLPNKSH